MFVLATSSSDSRFRRLLLAAILAACGASAVFAAGPPAADAHGKLGPFLRRVALGVSRRQGTVTTRLPARSRGAVDTLPPFVRADRTAADPILYVDARLDGAVAGDGPFAAARARLEAAGARVRGRSGSIVSLAIPASAIERVAALPEVRWLRAGRRFRLQNDVSTSDAFTGARTENATFGNAGDGVIIAVIDTGIDWADDDFRNPDGTTRVLGIWDQTLTDASHPPPAGFDFGAYYSRDDIDAALATSGTLATQDGYGHGTHVAGSAAGNGRHTGNGIASGTFAGMAPRADLLIVRLFDDTGTFCDACDVVAATQFIDDFAHAAGEPWVANMSFGDDVGGAHDGTSPDEIAIDAAVGPGRPGAQVAIAAGNSGSSTQHFHWEDTLADGQTFTNTFSLPYNLGSMSGPDNDFIWLDLWYSGEDSATVEIQTPLGAVVSAAPGADSGIVCTDSGAVWVDATNVAYPENGDNEVFVEISDSSTCAPSVVPSTGPWTVRVIADAVGPAGGGGFDAWTEATARGNAYANFATYSLAKSVSVPGTSRHALTAGAYISKTSWINGAGGTTSVGGTVGALAFFSAVGPTRDGRIKPDVAAPGYMIGSSTSSLVASLISSTYKERDNVHHVKDGTSMATPHVAGAAALLFGLDPDLDGAQVVDILHRTARADLQTGSVPNLAFGWGKLRALDAAYDAATLVRDLAATGTPDTFSWSPAPTVDSWNVYRGALPGISATDYGTCFQSGLPSPGFTDAQVPAPGTGFFYLTTGVYTNPTTHLAVESGLGSDSAGNLRQNSAPCP